MNDIPPGMRLVALFAGLFVLLVGLVGLAAPERLLAIGRYSLTPLGLYIAAAIRIGIGLVLLRVASASRSPGALRVIGILAVIAGVITLVVGVDSSRAVFEWSSARGLAFIRLSAGLALALGAFIVYALTPARRG